MAFKDCFNERLISRSLKRVCTLHHQTKTHSRVFKSIQDKTETGPLQSVPEAADHRRPVGACDWFPHGAADVMEDVVAALYGHLHPGGALDWI